MLASWFCETNTLKKADLICNFIHETTSSEKTQFPPEMVVVENRQNIGYSGVHKNAAQMGNEVSGKSLISSCYLCTIGKTADFWRGIDMRGKIVSTVLAVSASVLLAGCGADSGEKDLESTEEQVVIRFFSNLPQRENGQGLVEQMLIDEYMEQNQNVVIEVEALDEEAYKIKFKAYCIEGMADVVSIWGQPSFLDEVLEAGILAELEEEDYADYKFAEGSLDGFKKDGKLYGLPRGTDIACFYYNKKMFEEHGWKIPDTYGELLELGREIRAEGIVPVAIDGGDGWLLAVYLSDLINKIADDYAGIVSRAVEKGDFSDPVFAQAVRLMKDAVEAGLFQDSYDSQERGAAKHLFKSGQAAMLYTGSWDSAMALSEDIAEDIRTNIRAFSMPVVEGGEGEATDIAAWNGGGYAVFAESRVKEEAIRFLNFMYRPDRLSRYEWEAGNGMSAQDQSEYIADYETELQRQLMDMLENATSRSGTPLNDCGLSEFKESIEGTIADAAGGTMDIDTFLQNLGKACKRE